MPDDTDDPNENLERKYYAKTINLYLVKYILHDPQTQ